MCYGRYARGDQGVFGEEEAGIQRQVEIKKEKEKRYRRSTELTEIRGEKGVDVGIEPGKIEGGLSAAGLRFGIVVSRFNSFITERLLSAAVDALERAGAESADVDVVRVPGSFELPLVSKKMAATGRYDALIAIGCVIRGETSHYDYVCSETARGLQLAQMDSGVPIMFCVLTCDTLEQAIDRAGLKGGNKGFEAGLAAIEMAQVSRKLRDAGQGKAKATKRATSGKTRRK
jgi:6,7-dimethyl-8-ribityllumazine synthase